VSGRAELLSIIVPVYNEVATSRALIDRLLAIDLPLPREILVVNDGSTDGTRDVLDAIEADAAVHLESLRADGGAASNDLLMQIQADVLGRPVVRSAVTETTALGAAYLAGLGVGLWSGLDEIAQRWRADRTFEPRWPASMREERYGCWRRAVERAQGWIRED